MATRSPRASPRLRKRARDAVRHGVELEIGELARRLLAAEIDDGGLGQVAVADDQVAEVGEGGIGCSSTYGAAACSAIHPFGGGGGAVK